MRKPFSPISVPLSLLLLTLLILPLPAAAQAPALQGRPFAPAGELVLDAATEQTAVGALPVTFVRSPDGGGPDGLGRYLVVVNSGYGLRFNAATNRGQQSLAVIDLAAVPAPRVIQNVYFPSPQSAQVGAVFHPRPEEDGSTTLWISGGVENQVWRFAFRPGEAEPISPGSPGPDTQVTAPSLSLEGFARAAPTPRANEGHALVYPLGLALSPDGDTLYTANNLAGSLGIVRNLRGERRLAEVDLAGDGERALPAPYQVVALPSADGRETAKVYVSCWGSAEVAVVDPRGPRLLDRIPVGRHPTAMALGASGSRLYVVNSNADTVSVIDTAADREIERIPVGLVEGDLVGASPEGLALSADGATLYAANAHAHAVAVVRLSAAARGLAEGPARPSSPSGASGARPFGMQTATDSGGTAAIASAPAATDAPPPRSSSAPPVEAGEPAERDGEEEGEDERSRVIGFIPAGLYPSAVAVADGKLFIGNGKGTGFESSSLEANLSGRAPNAPNDRFPAGPPGTRQRQGGQYSVSLLAGNLSWLDEPEPLALAELTRQAMRSHGLLGPPRSELFGGRPSPIRHVIYVIKENRTYDQVFGDLPASGDGTPADGDPGLAIFGAGEAARRPGGPPQDVTPNHRALALRFGLLDRFFVNSEASPDGHNWSTAAFSSDYTDKAYRWLYSDRGQTYDFEGFNRLPTVDPVPGEPPLLPTPATAADIAAYMRRYIPYLQGGRDVAEPETLYLWDAAARAGLTYRNYGEFVGTLSRADVEAFNRNERKGYPDISPTEAAFPTKKSLEGHVSPSFRNYDLETPDAMTVGSYQAALDSGEPWDALISPAHPEPRFRGTSRLGVWLEDFRGFVTARERGEGEDLPNLSILRLPNDHTAGLRDGMPTPQLLVADNDLALGLLVETVSHSPYWRDTAIFVVEDDAQDGPDHVDAHRSVALVISAWNRPGERVHEFHSTVSLIRTLELLLGLPPMNALDATAVPLDLFGDEPDLTPYEATLPRLAPDNRMNPGPVDTETAYWIRRTEEQNLVHADLADPGVLNQILWFSVRGAAAPAPEIARLPAFDALAYGIAEEAEEAGEGGPPGVIERLRTLLARRGAGPAGSPPARRARPPGR